MNEPIAQIETEENAIFQTAKGAKNYLLVKINDDDSLTYSFNLDISSKVATKLYFMLAEIMQKQLLTEFSLLGWWDE